MRFPSVLRLSIAALLLAIAVTSPFASQALGQDATPAAEPGYAFPEGVFPGIKGDVILPENPTRIITLTDGALDLVLSLGLQPVGYTASSNGVGAAAYLADKVSPEAEIVGGWSELDLEKVKLLEADIILTDRYVDAVEGAYDLLVATGVPVIATGEIEVNGPDALQQWEYEALGWGHALGMYDEALAQIMGVRERAAAIKAELGDKAGQSVVVFRPQFEFPVVMSHNWITGTVLTWAGFVGNELTADMPPPHSGRDISLEQLDVLDADWLLAAARDQEMQDALAAYKEMPLFAALPAVPNDQVVLVEGDLWSGATGVLAAHAMLDDIEEIFLGGAVATPAA